MNKGLKIQLKRSLLNLMVATFFTFQVLTSNVFAHLMVAQHGTLNMIENDVFMMLSLPVSGFDNIDENTDGLVSMVEFNHSRASIIQQVSQQISMRDQQGRIELQSIMLSPVVDHHNIANPVSQITIMGKFVLRDAKEKHIFAANIFGNGAAEKRVKITAKRKALGEKHTFELSPNDTTAELFK